MKMIYKKPLTSIEEAFYEAFVLAGSTEGWGVEGEGAPGTGGSGDGPPGTGGMGVNMHSLWDEEEE